MRSRIGTGESGDWLWYLNATSRGRKTVKYLMRNTRGPLEIEHAGDARLGTSSAKLLSRTAWLPGIDHELNNEWEMGKARPEPKCQRQLP